MAKQTFSVGQVLTAAQLTSLQQTAMGGGAASAKTASYTLVAADAGTTISMTSTSATTITVNTGLFAAGDTVFIQNLGSGNCTVTAGTATVSTAGSLILPTNDAGILYFVSTGVAVFYDFIQVGATSPLTTKGDLYGFSTSDARIPIGANNTVLTADSNESLGLKWAAPASGGKVLQVVMGSTSTQVDVVGGSYATTGLSASITPSAATSKILILIAQQITIDDNDTQANAAYKLRRDSIDIYTIDNGASDGLSLAIAGLGGGPNINLKLIGNGNYLDSPSSTSAISYNMQGKATAGQVVSFQEGNSTSTLILLEIGA